MPDDDLLQQADALMRRHRVFVAGASETTQPVVEPSAVDDVPVLTEVVNPDAMPAVAPAGTAARGGSPLPGQLAYELEAWLDEELPLHVMRVLDGVTDQLIVHLSQKARNDLLPRLQALLDQAPPGDAPAPDSE